jgi:teichoic acid transport system permease protein
VWSAKILLSMYFLATMIVVGMGLAPYLCRTPGLLPRYVDLFAVPCTDLDVPVPDLLAPEHLVGRYSGSIMTLIQLNPMYSMLGGYTELLQNDSFPPTYMWISSAVSALVAAVIGFLYFISREREFAVRLV